MKTEKEIDELKPAERVVIIGEKEFDPATGKYVQKRSRDRRLAERIYKKGDALDFAKRTHFNFTAPKKKRKK